VATAFGNRCVFLATLHGGQADRGSVYFHRVDLEPTADGGFASHETGLGETGIWKFDARGSVEWYRD